MGDVPDDGIVVDGTGADAVFGGVGEVFGGAGEVFGGVGEVLGGAGAAGMALLTFTGDRTAYLFFASNAMLFLTGISSMDALAPILTRIHDHFCNIYV